MTNGTIKTAVTKAIKEVDKLSELDQLALDLSLATEAVEMARNLKRLEDMSSLSFAEKTHFHKALETFNQSANQIGVK